jgi:hypothetical protein
MSNAILEPATNYGLGQWGVSLLLLVTLRSALHDLQPRTRFPSVVQLLCID